MFDTRCSLSRKALRRMNLQTHVQVSLLAMAQVLVFPPGGLTYFPFYEARRRPACGVVFPSPLSGGAHVICLSPAAESPRPFSPQDYVSLQLQAIQVRGAQLLPVIYKEEREVRSLSPAPASTTSTVIIRSQERPLLL